MDHSSNIILASLPGTVVQLRKRTGFARSTVARAIVKLHAAEKCHVVDWAESAVGKNGPLLAVYVRGKGVDAPCPVQVRPKAKGPVDGLMRARLEAIAGANKASKVRDPYLWCMFDMKVTF